MNSQLNGQISINLIQDLSIKDFLILPYANDLLQPITIKDIKKRNINKEFKILQKYTLYGRQQFFFDDSIIDLKNRYSDISCYKHNRVKIDNNYYINGNWIHDPINKGNLEQAIITQGPLDNTQGDFWDMIYTYKVSSIIAIVEQNLLGKTCSQYWPRKNKTMNIGDKVISVVKESKNQLYEYKVLQIQVKNEIHQVEHFYLYQWQDRQIPEKKVLQEFLQLLHDLIDKQKPMVFHCSAGIGRSGTIMTSFFLYQEFLKAKQQQKEFKFSIFELVRNLREQRFAIIQNAYQYEFLYQIVQYFFTLK